MAKRQNEAQKRNLRLKQIKGYICLRASRYYVIVAISGGTRYIGISRNTPELLLKLELRRFIERDNLGVLIPRESRRASGVFYTARDEITRRFCRFGSEVNNFFFVFFFKRKIVITI